MIHFVFALWNIKDFSFESTVIVTYEKYVLTICYFCEWMQ